MALEDAHEVGAVAVEDDHDVLGEAGWRGRAWMGAHRTTSGRMD